MLNQFKNKIDFTMSDQDVVKLSDGTFAFDDLIRIIQPLLDYQHIQLATLDEKLALEFYSVADQMKFAKSNLTPEERVALSCGFMLVNWFGLSIKRVLKIKKQPPYQGLMEEVFVQFTKQCVKQTERTPLPPNVTKH